MALNENILGQPVGKISLQDKGAKQYDAYRDMFGKGTTVSDDLVNLMVIGKQRGTQDAFFLTALGNLVSGNTDAGTKQLASRQLELTNAERTSKGMAALNIPGAVTATFGKTAPGAFTEVAPTAPGTPASYRYWSLYNTAVSKYQADLAAYNQRKAAHEASVTTYNAELATFNAEQVKVRAASDAVLAKSSAKADELVAGQLKDEDVAARKARAETFRTSLLDVAARLTVRPTNLVTPSSVLQKTQLGGTDDRK